MSQIVNIHNVIKEYERSICKVVLTCVTELPFQLGISKTASILKGTKSTFIIDNDLYKLETFGILGNFTAKQLRQMIEILIEFELIRVEKITGLELPVLSITNKSLKYIDNDIDTEIVILDAFVDRKVYQFDEQEKELFSNLKATRRELAAKADVPAFTVCGDQLLRKICELKPADRNELLSIKGIGERFVNNYGEQILSTIREFYSDRK